MGEQATYRINQLNVPPGTMCICSHSIGAHGSNGIICTACDCKKFVEAHDAKRPVSAEGLR